MYRIVLLLLSVVMFSCVKKGNYACTCSSNNVLIQKELYNDINAKNAEDKCDDLQTHYRNLDSIQAAPGVTCTLN